MANGFNTLMDENGLRLTLCRPASLVQINFWRNVEQNVSDFLELSLPTDGRSASTHGTGNLFRVSPKRVLIVDMGDPSLFSQIKALVTIDAGTVSDLSHARMSLTMQGVNAETLLKRLVSIDLRPAHFPVGQFAQTFVQDANVLIHRTAEDHFSILIPTSFATSLWDTVRHAAETMHLLSTET